jgi:hypothetical protein
MAEDMTQNLELPPEAYGPPAIVLDAEGVTEWLGGRAHSRILWSQLESVEIGVALAPDVGYSEAFWRLAGGGVEFIAPVELIVNADQLRTKLFALPGFDMGAYRRGREAEAVGQPGEFICWRKGNA